VLTVGGPNAPGNRQEWAPPRIDRVEIKARINEIVSRWPAVGVAVGVVRGGALEFFGHGVADIRSGAPITEDTPSFGSRPSPSCLPRSR
jgi:CubicO group peptidase (beta-lactamase class C family)